MTVSAYGTTRSVATSREHIIDIVDPTLLYLEVPSLTTEDQVIDQRCEYMDDLPFTCDTMDGGVPIPEFAR